MKTFITEVLKDGVPFAGPEIHAKSWAAAERKAHRLGVVLVGELG